MNSIVLIEYVYHFFKDLRYWGGSVGRVVLLRIVMKIECLKDIQGLAF